MANPLAVATKGKGLRVLAARAVRITRRYGLSADKMCHALNAMAGVLQNYDSPATLPVTALALARNPSIAQPLQAVGIEWAVHGLSHIDYQQLSLDQQRQHLQHARAIFKQAGLKPVGFRCPYLRWNEDTLTALREADFAYDSSPALAFPLDGVASAPSYERVLAFYGAQMASETPALPRMVDGLVRIPYCLPDDEALVERLGLSGADEMSAAWIAMLERTYADGELFTLGLHPERAIVCLCALKALLARARALSPAVWIASLSQINDWVRALSAASFEAQPMRGGVWRLQVQAPTHAILLARSVAVQAELQPWGPHDLMISGHDVILRSERAPWVGLSPQCPPAMLQFLRQLGYLVQISPDGAGFASYFDQSNFSAQDERPLLAALENGSQPLIRLGRWPGGARSALAVTGDVDSFTLWDYGLRVLNR